LAKRTSQAASLAATSSCFRCSSLAANQAATFASLATSTSKAASAPFSCFRVLYFLWRQVLVELLQRQ